MKVEHEKKFTVKSMCKAFKISESGYYRHKKCMDRPDKDKELLTAIKNILKTHNDNDNYGIERMYLALRQNNIYAGKARVRRVMKKNGLIHKLKRHPNGITREDSKAQKSENIIQRDFTAKSPYEKVLTDITEVKCADGKLYVSPIMDCFNGEILALTMEDNMRAELWVQSLESACKRHGMRNMILHSDRGSQYTSKKFRDALKKYDVVQSMSGTGRCYDNCRMESFFATLKKEKLYRINTEKYKREYIKRIIWRYVFVYYNRIRVYTTNPEGLAPALYINMEILVETFFIAVTTPLKIVQRHY